MTIKDYYIQQQMIPLWYNKFFSTSDEQSGKTFPYMNTNFRFILSFLEQFKKFKEKVGKDRNDWNDKLPCGQEKDKHRIERLIQAGFIEKEFPYYYYTSKGPVALDLINNNYLSKQEKWILLFMLLLDYKSEFGNFCIIDTVGNIFYSLESIGLTKSEILNMIKNLLTGGDKYKLFYSDIFWLISFIKEETFIELFLNSNEYEKNELKNYVCYKSKHNKDKKEIDLVTRRYTSGGVYGASTFFDDINVIYYTVIAMSLIELDYDSYTNEIIEEYCKNNIGTRKNKIFDFINNHRSIYKQIKENIRGGL